MASQRDSTGDRGGRRRRRVPRRRPPRGDAGATGRAGQARVDRRRLDRAARRQHHRGGRMGRAVAAVADRQSGTRRVHDGPVADRGQGDRTGPAACRVHPTGTDDIRDGHPPSWTVDRLAGSSTGSPGCPRHSCRAADDPAESGCPRCRTGDQRRDRQLAAERDVHCSICIPFDDGTGALRARDTRDGLHLAYPGINVGRPSSTRRCSDASELTRVRSRRPAIRFCGSTRPVSGLRRVRQYGRPDGSVIVVQYSWRASTRGRVRRVG